MRLAFLVQPYSAASALLSCNILPMSTYCLSNINYNDNAQLTTEAQLGLIGGTMGLLTGFSILSGVEIIYYLLRYILTFDEE